jgi:diacylglycerol kinase
MIDPFVTTPNPSRRHDGTRPGAAPLAAELPPRSTPTVPADDRLSDLEPSPEPAAQADRRNVQGKLAAGWRGLKAAVRGDSSFFAHSYRGTLIVIAAAMLGVDFRGWCLLVLGACLVLLSELTHSAVDTLARAIGDPEEFRLKTAREIAAAGVLVAAVGSAAVTLIVLTTRLFDLLGWRL